MILISSKKHDFFTDSVIKRLLEFGVTDFARINEDYELIVESINLLEKKIILYINGLKIDFDDVSFFWYRGGTLPMPKHDWLTENKKIAQQVKRFVNYEWKVLREFLFFVLQQKEHIGNYFLAETNKLRNLCIAKECDLLIPDTYIAQNNFSEKINRGSKFIVKPIGECFPFSVNEQSYRLFTKEIDADFLENDTRTYFPSLLQNKIDIDFEIRVFAFYEYREFYAMAIFTAQTDNIDYRKFVATNRYVPYSLPENVREKLLLFMKKMQLDTASFDLIKTKSGEYVFLEVNPFGNIEMINETCGYEIDRRFAEIIIDKYNNII